MALIASKMQRTFNPESLRTFNPSEASHFVELTHKCYKAPKSTSKDMEAKCGHGPAHPDWSKVKQKEPGVPNYMKPTFSYLQGKPAELEANFRKHLGYKPQAAVTRVQPRNPVELTYTKTQTLKGTSTVTKPPFNPDHVLSNFKKYLTDYEQREIHGYQQVWYVGKTAKKIQACQSELSRNSGYDTQEGAYRVIINDHLAYRYQILKVIGQGFSGQVLKCMDHNSKKLVAIKVFRNNDSIHQDPMPLEDILKALKDFDKDNSDSNVHMREKFTFRSHLCITFELPPEELYGSDDTDAVVEEELEKCTMDMLKCLQELKERIVQNHLKLKMSPSVGKKMVLMKSKNRMKITVPSTQPTVHLPPVTRIPRRPHSSVSCNRSRTVRTPAVTCLNNTEKIKRTCVVSKPPYPPEHILSAFRPYMTKFEQEEIQKQKWVWYFGKDSKKFHQFQFFRNHVYDTKEGFYKIIINDHLTYRYQILEMIGQGYSGQVLKCLDHKSRQLVAIKVFRNKSSCHEEGLAEVRMLQALRDVDKDKAANIVHMKENFVFRKHLCITFELFPENLKTLYRSNNGHLSEKELKIYAVDMLKCLHLLKLNSIVHGDLKPENVLIYVKNDEKHAAVADFGASYFMREYDLPCMYTRYYSPPEVLLQKKCRPALDMWSLGCTIAELHRGRRFFKGYDDKSVFCSIMELLGVPDYKLLTGAPNTTNFFDVNGLPYKLEEIMKRKITLSQKLQSSNVKFINFIERCLEYDPTKRMTPEEALQHPWILHEEFKCDKTLLPHSHYY